jgi:phasin family protein
MPNPRQEPQETRQLRDASKAMAEHSDRVGQTMADLGDQAARTSADVTKRGIETWQTALQSGTELASQLAHQSTDQLARALGVGSDEAQKATQQSSRNIEAMARSSGILAQSVQEISREYFELWRKIMARSLGSFETLARARTPQEVLAAQSEIIRDNTQEFLQTTRRTAETSIKMADEATKNFTDLTETSRRAA